MYNKVGKNGQAKAFHSFHNFTIAEGKVRGIQLVAIFNLTGGYL